MSKKASNNSIQIPVIKRDGPLIKRLIPVLVVGSEKQLDKESRLYIRALSRLVDKSFDEYMCAREYIIEEIRENDKLAYRIAIINHLEDSVNALNRAINILEALIYGKNKTVKSFNILNFINSTTLQKTKTYNVSKIRNKIEHLDEDIFDNKVSGGIFVDVDERYKQICINSRCLSLYELTSAIEDYHNLVLEIFQNLK